MTENLFKINRQQLNKNQTRLRELLNSNHDHAEAIDVFFQHHAQLHSARVAQPEWSFEDAILDDMTEAQMRAIPPKGEHSVVWLIWHMARIEDVTMNLLVARTPQIFNQGNWVEKLQTDLIHTGNAMSAPEMVEFSQAVNAAQLRKYRVQVGCRTREIVRDLKPEDLKRKVSPSGIQQVWDQGGLLDDASGSADYWSKRNIAGLLLMPATRHNIVHLNEALKIKKKVIRYWFGS